MSFSKTEKTSSSEEQKKILKQKILDFLTTALLDDTQFKPEDFQALMEVPNPQLRELVKPLLQIQFPISKLHTSNDILNHAIGFLSLKDGLAFGKTSSLFSKATKMAFGHHLKGQQKEFKIYLNDAEKLLKEMNELELDNRGYCREGYRIKEGFKALSTKYLKLNDPEVDFFPLLLGYLLNLNQKEFNSNIQIVLNSKKQYVNSYFNFTNSTCIVSTYNLKKHSDRHLQRFLHTYLPDLKARVTAGGCMISDKEYDELKIELDFSVLLKQVFPILMGILPQPKKIWTSEDSSLAPSLK